jgi:hypothetical protein
MTEGEDLREFMLIVRRALLMIIAWIDKRYLLDKSQEEYLYK